MLDVMCCWAVVSFCQAGVGMPRAAGRYCYTETNDGRCAGKGVDDGLKYFCSFGSRSRVLNERRKGVVKSEEAPKLPIVPRWENGRTNEQIQDPR